MKSLGYSTCAALILSTIRRGWENGFSCYLIPAAALYALASCSVFFAYAIVTLDEAVLYVDAAQLEERGRDHLAHSNVSVRPYTALFEDLKAFKTKLAIGPFTDKTGSEKRRVYQREPFI